MSIGVQQLASFKFDTGVRSASIKKRIVSLIVCGLFSVVTFADTYNIIIEKQKEKQKYRWSIDQWFETRDRMRMQDLWFALHAPSPYEFYFGGNYEFARLTGSTSIDDESVRLFIAGYAKIFGLEIQKEFRASHFLMMAHIRVFGYSAQSTNITLSAGVRSVENPARYHNPFLGGSIAIYITKYVGGEFLYRYYLESFSNLASIVATGNRIETNGFTEFIRRSFVSRLL